ncbi:MAG: chromosomal replication initiator protein DnaA [Rickettsiales bacterium]|nr:chromosomal replication initiator protein DnaA [Rickettsiales bacterium]|tara:strand:- start:8249 stop:9616 length:1368 start_codon:yes stop_codon:yes gene_type:complete
MTQLLRSQWEEVCGRVRATEEAFFHDPWLDRISFVSSEDDTVVLATPNRLYVEFIQENLEPLLLAHLGELTGETYQIDYRLDASLENRRSRSDEAIVNVSSPAPIRNKDRPDRFRPNPRKTFASFVIGGGNQFATAAAQNVADFPAKNYNPLFIFGGVGLGKTHLLNAIGNRILQRDPNSRLVYMSAEDFTNEMIHAIRYKRMEAFRERYRQGCDALLVDDIQSLGGKMQTQEEFFHTFNALHNSGKQIVVTADRYPKDIIGLEERLRSRFDWGLVADVQPHDTETKVAILRKKADEEGIELPHDVAFFIARHAASNIRLLEGTLTRLLAMSSFHAAPITLDYARSCLEGYLQVDSPQISVDSIITSVAKFFDIKVSDMKGPRRTRQLVVPRQIAMYLSRKHTGLSLPEIGKNFGGRDHTTVMYAVRKVEKQLSSDDAFRRKVDMIRNNTGLKDA